MFVPWRKGHTKQNLFFNQRQHLKGAISSNRIVFIHLEIFIRHGLARRDKQQATGNLDWPGHRFKTPLAPQHQSAARGNLKKGFTQIFLHTRHGEIHIT